MRSTAIFLTIFPVLPICFFTMDVKLSQQQQFSCHILEDYHLSGSQRQQAAAPPNNQCFGIVHCLTVLCPGWVSHWRGHQYTKASTSSDYTREFRKEKKNTKDLNLTCLWDMQRGRARAGAQSFLLSGKQRQQLAFGSFQLCAALQAKETHGIAQDQGHHQALGKFLDCVEITALQWISTTSFWLPSYAVFYRSGR